MNGVSSDAATEGENLGTSLQRSNRWRGGWEAAKQTGRDFTRNGKPMNGNGEAEGWFISES
jgi:hypothetical protein